MDTTAKRELAQAIVGTHRIREDSYVPGNRMSPGYYAEDYDEAMEEAGVDPDIRPLVKGMLIAGYVDFHDWARKTLAASAGTS